MRVFVTGGTGIVGCPVIAELLEHGHTVLALARSDASARAVELAGADAMLGGLADVDVLRDGVEKCDAVIHLAFGRDYGTADALAKSIAEERTALAAMGAALTGTNRPIVTASGTPWLSGHVSAEADPLATEGPVGQRAQAVNALLDLASQGVRSVVVRLARTVHNEGDGGFAGVLTDVARRTGVAGYPGDGAQRWPAVHALDAAALFRLALELAPAGTSWHAVSDEGVAVRDIARVIGRRLGLPVKALPQDHFGPFGPIFAMDGPATSAHTRAVLGWRPTHPGLLEDLENIQPHQPGCGVVLEAT